MATNNTRGTLSCPKCHKPTQPQWKVCPHCETQLSDTPLCARCGVSLGPVWRTCPECGRKCGPLVSDILTDPDAFNQQVEEYMDGVKDMDKVKKEMDRFSKRLLKEQKKIDEMLKKMKF